MGKKVLSVLCMVALVFTFCVGCGDSGAQGDTEQTYNFKLAMSYPIDHADTQAAQRAADTIKEKTNGHVNITIYPSSQLGDYQQVYEEVMMGTIDMACITLSTTYDSRLEMLTIPYLVSSYDESVEKFSSGSEYYGLLEGVLNDAGLHPLCIFNDGFMGIGATKKIENATDYTIAHKELLRVPAMDSYIWTAKAMGYNTTTIAYSDLYSALQTGVADGWIGGSAYVNKTSFGDVLKYYVDNKYILELIVGIMNNDKFSALPEEYQKIINEAFQAEAVTVANDRQKLDDQAMKDMDAAGITVEVPSEEEIQKVAAHFKETVWPKYKDILGDELYNKLLA